MIDKETRIMVAYITQGFSLLGVSIILFLFTFSSGSPIDTLIYSCALAGGMGGGYFIIMFSSDLYINVTEVDIHQIAQKYKYLLLYSFYLIGIASVLSCITFVWGGLIHCISFAIVISMCSYILYLK